MTGFHVGHLLAELLRSAGSRVHCLVRAGDGTADPTRIGLGDLADERLGPETAAELVSRVDTVVHAAATVNGALSYGATSFANSTCSVRSRSTDIQGKSRSF